MKGQDILEGASLYNEILYYEILFQKSFLKRNPFCFLKHFFRQGLMKYFYKIFL